jgi:ribulose-phosphate 3-epimerase
MRGEIIPVILAKNFDDFEKKLKIIKSLKPKPTWIQIDVVDGRFAPFLTFHQISKIVPSLKKFNLEIHLMVINPIGEAQKWLKAGAKRILFQIEGFFPSVQRIQKRNWQSKTLKKLFLSQLTNHWEKISQLLHRLKSNQSNKIEIGLALEPNTPLEAIFPLIKQIDVVLLLGVKAGQSGQRFQPQVLKKIRTLRQKYPSLPIEVDGGVKLENIAKMLKAGANRFACASALINHPQPQIVYQKFLNLLSCCH